MPTKTTTTTAEESTACSSSCGLTRWGGGEACCSACFPRSKTWKERMDEVLRVLYVWVPQNSIFYIRQILLGSRAILGSSCELSPEPVS